MTAVARGAWVCALLVGACASEPPATVVDSGPFEPLDVPRDRVDAANVDSVNIDAGLGFDLPAVRDVGGLDVPGDGAIDHPAVSTDQGASRCSMSAPCAAGSVCVDGLCLADRGPCQGVNDCSNDTRCVAGLNRCVPYRDGETDTACTREVRPGVFAPAVQCRFSEAPTGDPYPGHLHVLSTPMVADLRVYRAPDDPQRPSIIAVFDDGSDGSSELPTGLIRVLDGRTCALQDNLTAQLVSHSSPPAVGDLDNDGVPEIVAFKAGGGLVAFRYERGAAGDGGLDDGGAVDGASADGASADGGAGRGRWVVYWRSTRNGMPDNPTGGGWAGPSLVDLDDDGFAEVLRHGAVYDGRTGAYRGGDSVVPTVRGYSAGGFSVVADVDEDGEVELVTGSGVYAWNRTMQTWSRESWYARTDCAVAGCGEGHPAIANFGAYTSNLVRDPRIPEVAVVSAGHVRIDTLDGRTVFGPIALPGGGTGGTPTVADFDGDGFPEIAAAGAQAYTVFDPDCAPVATVARLGGRCDATARTGVLWSRPSQDASSNVTGSTSFDFEGDGRVEAVYADECFARVYDGRTGTVLFSQHHSSCTWYENPVVADVDGDLRAELVVGSNFNCGSTTTGIACPGTGPRGVDVQFAGIRCASANDCPSGVCLEGFCRCLQDSDCCAPSTGGADAGVSNSECTYVCAAPPAGTPGSGFTCRAARPVGVRGIRVYSDVADRWVGSRPIWNQHAYSVTNVGDNASIPATSAARLNWREASLNNFRTNVQGSAETMRSPDATSAGEGFVCLASGAAELTARACNRGTATLPDGLPVGFYDRDPAAMGATRVCQSMTPRALAPGECVRLRCTWSTPPQETPLDVRVVADDGRSRLECHEGNNLAVVPQVVCRPPG